MRGGEKMNNPFEMFTDSTILKIEPIYDDLKTQKFSGVILKVLLKNNQTAKVEIWGCDMYDEKICNCNDFDVYISLNTKKSPSAEH